LQTGYWKFQYFNRLDGSSKNPDLPVRVERKVHCSVDTYIGWIFSAVVTSKRFGSVRRDIGWRLTGKSMITCNRCKQDKPDMEYLEANGRGRGPDGRFLWCRHCRDTYLSRLNELKRRRRKNQEEAPMARLHRDDILKVEQARRRISDLTGVQHHVEHIVPLSGERAKRPVCGLHVPWNVSLCSAALNLAKGAKFSDKDATRVEADQMAWLKARGLTKSTY